MLDIPPDRVAAVVQALDRAFRGERHDIFQGGQINAAPTRHDDLRRMFASGRTLTAQDLDWLVSKAMTTVGGPATLKFALPGFLAAVVGGGRQGAASDSHVVLPKLEQAAFASWPRDQQAAIRAALALWADQRALALAVDEWAVDPGLDELRGWLDRHA
jgi:hypothetical protein